MIGLENIPAVKQLIEAPVGDPDQVAIAEWKLQDIKQNNPEFSLYYTDFHVIAPDLNWNPVALGNTLGMGLSEEMNDSFPNTDMPEELPVFVKVCQIRDNQICQR